MRRATRTTLLSQLVEALRELGYVDGGTARFEIRTAEDSLDRLPALATELVQANVDIIVAVSPFATLAASKATRTTPIVMAFWGGAGLVESGVVASFARPGGNVTGVWMPSDDLEGKRLQFLLEALPRARKIAVVSAQTGDIPVPEVRRVAKEAKVELIMTEVPGAEGYGPVFQAMTKVGIDAAFVPSFPRFYEEHPQMIEAAARQRIPTSYEWGDSARAGGLMAYGAVISELQHQVARYVDKILKGTKAGDLPIEQPTRYELVINLKTAKALGIAIPQSLRLRADEVIQ